MYAESSRKSHTVIRPRNHDNGQGDRYHGDDILSGISTFLVKSYANLIFVYVFAMKRFQTKNTVPV